MDMSPPLFFPMKAMQRNATSVLPSQQRLLKIRFLQKLGCQKAWWDQPRLSSLVNKQVVMRLSEGLTKRWILQNSLSLIKHGYNASVKARNKTMPIWEISYCLFCVVFGPEVVFAPHTCFPQPGVHLGKLGPLRPQPREGWWSLYWGKFSRSL